MEKNLDLKQYTENFMKFFDEKVVNFYLEFI